MSDHPATLATAIELLNAGDVDGYITTLYAPDAVFHGFPPASTGPRRHRGVLPGSARRRARRHHRRRGPARGRGPGGGALHPHRHPYRGAVRTPAAAAERIDVEGITIVRFSGDRVVERWNRLDDVTFLTQIGAMPATTGV